MIGRNSGIIPAQRIPIFAINDAQRNAIPMRLRYEGLTVFYPDGSQFSLVKPLTNQNWIPTGSGGSFPTGLPDAFLKYDSVGQQLEPFSIVNLPVQGPTITPERAGNLFWELFEDDGITPYTLKSGSLGAKSITVDIGVKAVYLASWFYPTPPTGVALPTSGSGALWTGTLPNPDEGVPQQQGTLTSAAANTQSAGITLLKPKSGLIVSGSNVVFATGNDTAADTLSVNFRHQGYFGYSAEAALTDILIKALATKPFLTARSYTATGVTAGAGLYTYYCYPATLGALTNVIQNGSLPVLGAFTELAQVNVTTDAGLTVAYRVYRSNATQAFTSASLAFS